MDTVDKKTRSRIMSSVGQRDTGPELLLRKALYRLGFRYRLNDKKLSGSPDLVFSKYRAVIFVHGCFWHRHWCKYSTFPATRKVFWREKFNANKKRDRKNINALIKTGWRVLIVWQCAIQGKKSSSVVKKIAEWLKSDNLHKELPSIVK